MTKINFMKIDVSDKGNVMTETGVEEIGPDHPAYPLLQATQEVADKNPGELAVGWEATQKRPPKQIVFGAATLGELGGSSD